jgi:hypothetical protein
MTTLNSLFALATTLAFGTLWLAIDVIRNHCD